MQSVDMMPPRPQFARDGSRRPVIPQVSEVLIRKLAKLGDLPSDEKRALRSLTFRVRHLKPGEEVLREGDFACACCVLLVGYMHRYKVLPNGKRQIIAFHIPGDIPDLCGLHVSPLDFTLAASTPSAVGLVAHEDLHGLFDGYPAITQLLWRDSLLQASIAQAWIVGLGRRCARARLAHLFCELFSRSQALGLSDGRQCPLPISQVELADALGLTTVHLNRTLQALRREGLVSLEQGHLTIVNWARLADTAGFDPAYLHLVSRDRPLPSSLPVTERVTRRYLGPPFTPNALKSRLL